MDENLSAGRRAMGFSAVAALRHALAEHSFPVARYRGSPHLPQRGFGSTAPFKVTWASVQCLRIRVV